MKRQAYGLREREFFKLKILGIHEIKHALVGRAKNQKTDSFSLRPQCTLVRSKQDRSSSRAACRSSLTYEASLDFDNVMSAWQKARQHRGTAFLLLDPASH